MENSALAPLVKIDQQRIGQLFVDYLKSLEITAQLEPQDGAYIVYIQADKLDLGQQVFNEFAQQPYNPKYQHAAWQHGSTSSNDTHISGVSEFKTRFLEHAGVVTLSVFALCWFVFLLSQFGYANTTFNLLRFYSELSFAGLVGEPQRLLGPAFFHFSWLHIVFNTMWWWQLGGAIEKTYGKFTLMNLFLVSAIVSNLGQFLVSGSNFGGLSGVVYAVVGFVWWTGWLNPAKGLMLPKPIIGFMLFWLVLGFVDLLPVNVANAAHLLGLVSGCALALWSNKTFRQ
ncbi:rhomboid family intramembrane serine protease GlpG [Thalassotalea atypica]|uniref:rhomboid family intramembrane serine protease GlpG n=1 Tax=Thalassotalea atypica TaxID=2054316 RepID=UPI00257318BA|nr:rhomboid family intramembrane serine protease GlpG [Thalassotalea atypica]